MIEHGQVLYDSVLSVPLFVRLGGSQGQASQEETATAIRSGLAQSVDLFAGVLQQTGIMAKTRIDGLAWGVGRTHALAWRFAYHAGVHRSPRHSELRSIERDGWKLIEDSSGDLELYELRSDPGEEKNVAGKDAARKESLLTALRELAPPPRTREGVAPDTPEQLEALRAIGYIR